MGCDVAADHIQNAFEYLLDSADGMKNENMANAVIEIKKAISATELTDSWVDVEKSGLSEDEFSGLYNWINNHHPTSGTRGKKLKLWMDKKRKKHRDLELILYELIKSVCESIHWQKTDKRNVTPIFPRAKS